MSYIDSEFRVSEQAPRGTFEDRARQIHEGLKRDDGRASLVMVVDDTPTKLADETRKYGTAAKLFEVDAVFTTHESGEDAIGFFTAFRGLEQSESPAPVTMILDGELTPGVNKQSNFRKGKEVARHILQLCEDNNWKRPLFVSNSNEGYLNDEFNALYASDIVQGVTKDDGVFSIVEAIKQTQL